MMEAVRGWLLGVMGAALLAALAQSLMAQGPLKEVGRLICGLVVLGAVLSPLTHLDLPDPAALTAGYFQSVEEREEELRSGAQNEMKTIIEEHLEAYIVDKAEEMGIVCQAQCRCEVTGDGVVLPQEAVITGTLSETQREELTHLLEEELGLPAGQQSYCQGEEEGREVELAQG